MARLIGRSTTDTDVKRSRPPRRPALPICNTAIKYLDNGELDRLLRAATEEARQRGRLAPGPDTTPTKVNPVSGEPSLKQAPSTGKTAAIPLTRGQVNAVGAAF